MIQSLTECTVLVVDDDYYLAEFTCEALEEAGATVLGPYGSEADVLVCLGHTVPGYAVLDLNLGSGPSFSLAREMKALGIPTLLVTGYDQSIIPYDIVDLPCLQKPVTGNMLIAAVMSLVGRDRGGR
ncbi:MAG: response regulator transcription factor [Oxalobacteraceae bacterium]|nr:MAG: response regulator transcription factor [Oxalobacteraceae bacterium]